MAQVAIPTHQVHVADHTLTLAVAGNPNAGKTSLFNALTGLTQGVSNFPGTTVARREGSCLHNGQRLHVIDLPGTYSLTAASPDEVIARDAITGGEPDVIINVVDASNLERNLYLTVQLIETGVPLVIALNLVEQARSQGIAIDVPRLQQMLGNHPIVEINARSGRGLPHLLNTVMATAAPNPTPATPQPPLVDYGPELEAALGQVQAALPAGATPNPRWLALRLLEQDADWGARVQTRPGGTAAVALAAAHAQEIAALYGDDIDILTADTRYELIGSIVRQVISRSSQRQVSLTERIDAIVTHRLLGLPLFALVMYVVFKLIIDVSAPFLDWVDAVIGGPLTQWTISLLTLLQAPAWLQSLAVEGIIAGVGGVLVFVPGLLVLYFSLAVLEDSGYLARAAFVMDRLMQVVGLHGKSVIPLVLGFGCAVPAIYATRTIASRRDRLLTGLLVPLMSCSARLPVYVVFGLAFFGRYASTVIWLLYLLGIAVAIAAGLFFSRTLLKPESESAFVLELPPYRLPSLRSLWIHMWSNTREFVRNAGTVILAMSVLLWLLLHLPWGVTNPQDSAFGQVSEAIAPIFAPLGFGSWQASGALVTGIVAKEVVISTLSQVYASSGTPPADSTATAPPPPSLASNLRLITVGFLEATRDAGRRLVALLPGVALPAADPTDNPRLGLALQQAFSPLSAFSFLVFVLLYVPCISTIAAIRQEFGARWAGISAGYQTLAAWLAAFLVYQIGLLLGLG